MSNGCCDPRAPRPKTLMVSGTQVGVIGLEKIYNEVLDLGPLDNERLAWELITRFTKINYVPAGARDEYTEALVGEFCKCFRQAAATEPLPDRIKSGE